MPLATTRRSAVDAALVTLWKYLPAFMEKARHYQRLAGLMRLPPSHTAIPHDAEEIAPDGLDGEMKFQDREQDTSKVLGLDDKDQPVYGTRSKRGPKWQALIASIPAGPERDQVVQLLKRARVEIEVRDDRLDLTKKKGLGWSVRIHVKSASGKVWTRAKARGFRNKAFTHGWQKQEVAGA